MLASCLAFLLIAAKFHGSRAWHLEPPWEARGEAVLIVGGMPVRISSEDPFLLAQGLFGNEFKEGDATSEELPESSSSRTISYRYAKVGAAQLQILLIEGGKMKLLNSAHAETLGTWESATTLLPSTSGKAKIIFRARCVYDGTDAVAVKDIRISDSEKVIYAGRPTKNIRRAPTSTCPAVTCTFEQTSCQWTFSGFNPGNSKMYIENSVGQLASEPFLLPANAHLQLEHKTSDGGFLTVEQLSGPFPIQLWSSIGQAEDEWHRARIMLTHSTLPTVIVLKSVTTTGKVAIANTTLVDSGGHRLACGGNLTPIRPRKEEQAIRLTAIQTLENPLKSAAITTTTSLPNLKSFSFHEAKPALSAVLPIAPSEVGVINSSLFGLPPKKITVNSRREKNPHQVTAVNVEKFKKFGTAIKPINEPKNPFLSIPQISSLPTALQRVVMNKLSQMIDVNTVKDIESRPFTRENMDFIIQNAFNAFTKESQKNP